MITEFKLPKTNGKEFLENLKTLRCTIPFIMTSFHLDDKYGKVKKGAYQYITAPMDLKLLIHSIEKILGMELTSISWWYKQEPGVFIVP